MSLASPNIQYVDKYYKSIVSGFIHQLETTASVQFIIPDIVFAKQKNNVVTLRYGPHANTAYGNIIINTHKFPNCIYKWLLSVNMLTYATNPTSCFIGIHSSSGVFDTEYNAYSRFMAEKNSIYFAREVTVGAQSDRDKLIRNDDQYIKTSVLYQNNVTKGIHQIEMILNTKDKTLQYIDNGVDLRVAFAQMYLQRQSRLTITISNPGCSVQIMDFKMYSVK
eukprot:31693_1